MWKTLLSNSSCPLVCVCECDLASLAPRWLSGKENAQGKWAKRWRWKILLIIVLNASPRSACVCTLKREFIAIVMRVHSRERTQGRQLNDIEAENEMWNKKKKHRHNLTPLAIKSNTLLNSGVRSKANCTRNIMVAEWKFPYANEHAAHHEKKCLTESDTRPDDQVEVIVHWSK